MTPVSQILNSLVTASPLPLSVKANEPCWLNLSVTNPEAADLDPKKPRQLKKFIKRKIKRSGKIYGAGGYGEERQIYRLSNVFGPNNESEEPRSIHLGMDLWMKSGTRVTAVYEGRVHSFADNSSYGDYGPTIILAHEAGELRFYTLYGHLSKKSLNGLEKGKKIETGQQIGWLGKMKENVGWPPHLHFQVMVDMMGRSGDYPGVAKRSAADLWLARCPNPNLLLHITGYS